MLAEALELGVLIALEYDRQPLSGEHGGPKTALVELAKDDDSGYSMGFERRHRKRSRRAARSCTRKP